MSNELLKMLPELLGDRISDVFITAGKPPAVRDNGTIRHLSDRPPVSAEAIDALRNSLLDQRAAADYAAHGGYDLSLPLGYFESL